MDNFELSERYDGLSDETREALEEFCKKMQGVFEDLLDSAVQVINSFVNVFSSLADMVEENGEYIPRKKPIRPPKHISQPPNILFDKRVRIHRCRNQLQP